MYDPKRSFKILFFLGASILLIGVAFIVVPDSMISGLTEQLNHATSNSERTKFRKSIVYTEHRQNHSLSTIFNHIDSIRKL